VVTRGYMESRMVVALAGRCAERLVLGDAAVSTAGASDLELANGVAREMVYRCGFGRRTGPVALMDNEEVYLNRSRTRRVADISTEMAKVAYADVEELLQAAEAKAYWALAANYAALEALAGTLGEVESLTGAQLEEVLGAHPLRPFQSPFVEGFAWGPDGSLVWPGRQGTPPMPAAARGANGNGSSNGAAGPPSWWSERNPYQVRTDIADLLQEEG